MTPITETPLTVGEALQFCMGELEKSEVFYGHGTDNAWDEAVQLVLAATGLPADSGDSVLELAVDERALEKMRGWLRQRIKLRTPLPYLLGRAWFAGLEFLCDRRAIIPRSPIAELIHNDFQPWYSGPPPQRVLDLCCGGGCIGLATAHYHPQTQVDLADIDEHALMLASENIAHLALGDRVQAYRSDLFSALNGNRYDLILSNPPYVDARDLAEMPAEYHHEPELALGSGTDGLYLTRKILAIAGNHLEDHGLLVVEVGNSWEALEGAYPDVPFTWLEFSEGGHGVFALSAADLKEFSASLA